MLLILLLSLAKPGEDEAWWLSGPSGAMTLSVPLGKGKIPWKWRALRWLVYFNFRECHQANSKWAQVVQSGLKSSSELTCFQGPPPPSGDTVKGQLPTLLTLLVMNRADPSLKNSGFAGRTGKLSLPPWGELTSSQVTWQINTWVVKIKTLKIEREL